MLFEKLPEPSKVCAPARLKLKLATEKNSLLSPLSIRSST